VKEDVLFHSTAYAVNRCISGRRFIGKKRKYHQMFLLTIASKYPGYLSQFYARHRGLSRRSYQEQYRFLMADSFGSSEIWSVGMAAKGYRTERIYANARPLQQQWARENGLEIGGRDWKLKILAAQVNKLRPDMLFLNNHTLLPAAELRRWRRDIPSIRLVICWCGTPFQSYDIFREFDIVLSNIPELVVRFRDQGLPAYHINHAFDPRILDRIDVDRRPNIAFSFIGSVIMEREFHYAREQLLSELIRKTDLRIWGNIASVTLKDRMKNLAQALGFENVRRGIREGIPSEILQRIPGLQRMVRQSYRPGGPARHVRPQLARRVRTPVYGPDMFQRLHDSKITLNTHGDISSESASNMRLFEATGVGSCLLTDWKKNIQDLFMPDLEVVTFRDAGECAEKVRYLLARETERRRIAEAGQKRTLRDHTIHRRAEQVDEIIRSYLQKALPRRLG
jgi:spore maturation protein CgeB